MPKVGPNGTKKGPKSDSKVIPRTSQKPPKRETQTWGPYFLIFDAALQRNHYFPEPFLARNGKRDTRRRAWKRAEICEKLGNILFGLVCNTLGLKIYWHTLCTKTCTERTHLQTKAYFLLDFVRFLSHAGVSGSIKDPLGDQSAPWGSFGEPFARLWVTLGRLWGALGEPLCPKWVQMEPKRVPKAIQK